MRSLMRDDLIREGTTNEAVIEAELDAAMNGQLGEDELLAMWVMGKERLTYHENPARAGLVSAHGWLDVMKAADAHQPGLVTYDTFHSLVRKGLIHDRLSNTAAIIAFVDAALADMGMSR